MERLGLGRRVHPKFVVQEGSQSLEHLEGGAPIPGQHPRPHERPVRFFVQRSRSDRRLGSPDRRRGIVQQDRRRPRGASRPGGEAVQVELRLFGPGRVRLFLQ